jgi:hypothetical protein
MTSLSSSGSGGSGREEVTFEQTAELILRGKNTQQGCYDLSLSVFAGCDIVMRMLV